MMQSLTHLLPTLASPCAVPVPKFKRLATAPREGFFIEAGFKLETIAALPYDIVKEGLA